jgi:hypothetical protein
VAAFREKKEIPMTPPSSQPIVALFSVQGGKFHQPADPETAGTRENAWRPPLTACGITVAPFNYFETVQDANSHTGGRLEQFLCKHCRSENQRQSRKGGAA